MYRTRLTDPNHAGLPELNSYDEYKSSCRMQILEKFNLILIDMGRVPVVG